MGVVNSCVRVKQQRRTKVPYQAIVKLPTVLRIEIYALLDFQELINLIAQISQGERLLMINNSKLFRNTLIPLRLEEQISDNLEESILNKLLWFQKENRLPLILRHFNFIKFPQILTFQSIKLLDNLLEIRANEKISTELNFNRQTYSSQFMQNIVRFQNLYFTKATIQQVKNIEGEIFYQLLKKSLIIKLIECKIRLNQIEEDFQELKNLGSVRLKLKHCFFYNFQFLQQPIELYKRVGTLNLDFVGSEQRIQNFKAFSHMQNIKQLKLNSFILICPEYKTLIVEMKYLDTLVIQSIPNIQNPII